MKDILVCLTAVISIPTKYKWVAFSNDTAFEYATAKRFDNKKDCYNDMRDAVFSKMKWNTEYDEDFNEDDDAVGYRVHFTRDMIVHASYSGIYVYKIVDEDENPNYEDVFTEELIDYLKELGIWYW